MTRINFISVDHSNCYSNYYNQEIFCRHILHSEETEKAAVLVEDDASKENPQTFCPMPNKQVFGWASPEVRKTQKVLVELRTLIDRMNMNRANVSKADEEALDAFVATLYYPDNYDGSLADKLDLARFRIEQEMVASQEATWEQQQAFLKKKICELCDQGIEVIYVIGGGLHFDPKFISSLNLPYNFFELTPTPTAVHELPFSNIQQLD